MAWKEVFVRNRAAVALSVYLKTARNAGAEGRCSQRKFKEPVQSVQPAVQPALFTAACGSLLLLMVARSMYTQVTFAVSE